MKLNHLILLSALLLSTNGNAQTGGGTGAGGTGAGAAGTGTPIAPTPGTRVTPQPILPGNQTVPNQPVNPNPAQLPNVAQQGQVGQVSPGQNSQFVGTNAGATPLGADTNQLTLNTNQFETNLPATSRPGFTNRILATNTPGLLTNNSRLTHDQALSEADRRLLAQIRTAVYGSTQAPAPLGGPAIYFILRDGVVRLVGVVPNAEEQKRIENIVQQVPGVVRVYDALQIGTSAIPGQNSAPVPRQ
jgi:BON domain-containing protein